MKRVLIPGVILCGADVAQAYGMNFRRLDIEGHRMLISTI